MAFRSFVPGALASLALLSACPSGTEPDDAGPDAGKTSEDAGALPQDAGDSDGGAPPGDAGSTADAGPTPDAGAMTDGGTSEADAGENTDAGLPEDDAGMMTDAGDTDIDSGVDAGSMADAGEAEVSDAGSTVDAGGDPGTDAGEPIDAGGDDDAGALVDAGTGTSGSTTIQELLTQAAGGADAVNLALADVYVTYVREVGFTVQADAAGPAVFFYHNRAPEMADVAVGNRITLQVTSVGTFRGMPQIDGATLTQNDNGSYDVDGMLTVDLSAGAGQALSEGLVARRVKASAATVVSGSSLTWTLRYGGDNIEATLYALEATSAGLCEGATLDVSAAYVESSDGTLTMRSYYAADLQNVDTSACDAGGSGLSPTGALRLNEIDYDNVGSTELLEYIELVNTGSEPLDLSGHALLLVNGNGNSVYKTVDLTSAGSLPAGGYLVVHTPGVVSDASALTQEIAGSTNGVIQNGAPDAIVLTSATAILDALVYEGAMSGVDLGAPFGSVDLGDGTGLADSNTEDGALCRKPGTAAGGALTQIWTFCPTLTPGAANVMPD